MKSYLPAKTTCGADIMDEVVKAAEALVNNVPVALLAAGRNKHLVQRLSAFLDVARVLIDSRSPTMLLCINYEGESLQKATFLEVQLVDKKNTIVYSATTLDCE